MKPQFVIHNGLFDEDTPIAVGMKRIRLVLDRKRRRFIEIDTTPDGGLHIRGSGAITIAPAVSSVIEVRLRDEE